MAIIPGDQATASDVSQIGLPGGRLTIDDLKGEPVQVLDMLAKTTILYTHYAGYSLPLITDGGLTFRRRNFSESASLSIAAYASGEILDIFAYYDSGSGLVDLTALSWGTASANKGMAITDATNASPIVITAAGHGLTTGAKAYISGVGGNTAANREWSVTYIDANTFSLVSSTGNGAYTSGGYLCARSATNWAAQMAASVSAGMAFIFRTNDFYRYLIGEDESIYLGTVKLSAAGEVEDSQNKRFIWNAYHQVMRPLKRASAGNLEFVTGGAEAIMGTVDGANSLTMLPGGYGYVACSASGMLGVWG